MKTLHTILISAGIWFCITAFQSCSPKGTDIVDVIPEPEYVRLLGGHSDPSDCTITRKTDSSLGEEEYRILIKDGKVTVTAATKNGFLYADQTLFQLGQASEGYPDVEIKDKPRFKWRGLHLDCGRHFFSVEEVKRYIDIMALHKLNIFHWHLTEDQGWRIEIRKYPELTETGAWRRGDMLRNRTPRDKKCDSDLYGGYYTQEQLKEVVAYAAEKGITVVPEIDLPGHMQAALAAYPELGCTGGPYEVWNYMGVSKDVLCPGKEGTFEFLEDVFTEILDIFPSEYIHIGGDECPKERWEECPHCRARIKELGLKDDDNFKAEHYLQSYVMERVGRFLESKGRKIIGWDEILEGSLPEGAAVMSWRGSEGGKKAASLGHDAVMTPFSHMYLDYCQSLDRDSEPENIGGYQPVSKVYSYEPFTDDMTAEEQSRILGVQANLWTEYISDFRHIEYMLLPRLAAVSEVQWCQPGRKDKKRFMTDIERMMNLYENLGYNYAKHVYDISDEIAVVDGHYEIGLATAGSAEIRYTLDGSEPDGNSPLYEGKLVFSDTPVALKAAAFKDDLKTRTWCQEFIRNKAFGKSVTGNTPKGAGYEHLEYSSLVDGMRGNMSYNSGRWVAWLGAPMDVTIDMRASAANKTAAEEYSRVTVGIMRYKRDWIFGATGLKVLTSHDNVNFTEAASLDIPVNPENVPEDIQDYTVTFPKTDAPYLRVIASDTRSIPAWHAGAGSHGYLFADEIIVM